MKPVKKHNTISHFAGVIILALVLIAITALFYFFPELPPVTPLPKLTVSKVCFLPHNLNNTAKEYQLAELNAIWSPALISLPSSIVSAEFSQSQINWLQPPLKATHNKSMLLQTPYQMHPKSISPLIASTKSSAALSIPKAELPRTFDNQRAEITNQVNIKLSESLKDVTINMPPLNFQRWTAPGKPWSVTAYVYFPTDGKLQHAFLEFPSQNERLNYDVLQYLYRCRLSKSGTPYEGNITLYFSGDGTD